ncbi:MAG TPA: beta-L-arabinofuranosidase domain-containing protein [Candidatus Sulfotelmatobacter sp.]|nr:beta-L-arabinofuranosidase domain-containing protein [Candidatus Sulfotelmatobacter sp.]
MKIGFTFCAFVALTLLVPSAFGQDTNEPIHRLTPVPIQQVTIDDPFWSPRLELWRQVTLQDCFEKFDHDGAFTNFDRVRDGQSGDHGGPPWYDGLVYEMIRASSDFLVANPDPKLERQVDGYIQRIAAAQAKDPDGYIETWTELTAPNHRWGLDGGNDLWQHELYNAGALLDAGVHWYRATGRTDLLQVAVRMANDMCHVMGPPPKVNQVPGHPLGEEALVNLYLLFRQQPQLKAQMPVTVNEQDYLNLAEFWIDSRGNHNGRSLDWGSYAQDDEPVMEQQEMEGHAVRDCLLCSGLVAAGNVADRADYLTTAQRLWNNMVHCKMYVTGGLGAIPKIEGFGADYYLPNKTAYCEICASVAGGFFDENMDLTFANARYADALELELFNGALVGVSEKGNRYFYDNPLEVDGKHERWSWNPCPCCPPMFLKLMSALPGYAYAQEPDAVYVNQFIGSQTTLTLNDTPVNLRQSSHYPWDGHIKISVAPARATDFTLYIRLPGWCDDPRLSLNGRHLKDLKVVRGYACLKRRWRDGDVVELSLPMPIRRINADPRVAADVGRVALRRGPLVYCLEGVDNGGHVRNLIIPSSTPFKVEWRPKLLGGVNVIKGSALAADTRQTTNVTFTAIPYFAQDNREAGEMEVWVAEDPAKALQLSSMAAP